MLIKWYLEAYYLHLGSEFLLPIYVATCWLKHSTLLFQDVKGIKKKNLLPHFRKSINIFHRWILSQWLILDLAFYSTQPKILLSKQSFLPAYFCHIIIYFYNLYFHSSH